MKQNTMIQQTAVLLALVFLLPTFSMANSEPLTGKELAQKIFAGQGENLQGNGNHGACQQERPWPCRKTNF